nr:alpha-amylase family glycosyl hydrolase [uncultured Halomonas sp.]
MTRPLAPAGTRGQDWWRGAVIYQVYPRSFMDSNGDGVGDLPGVLARLDYIAELGVDAIWLSPFFTSPMKDFGYDVADYRGVDPLFGSLDDFDHLLEAAHARGLKIVIDQVLSHTSDQHSWFQESRSDRDNPKADWYVWAEARDDGMPPNNWLSVFGGSAWQWDSRRRQYYLHNFLASQPDLNFHHPDVQDAILGEVRFWLERGVDGFRLDAINFCTHDAQLRDNPAAETVLEASIGVRPDNPYGFQRHRFDKSQPENLVFLERLRALLDEYPGTTSVGEVGDDNALDVMADYTRGGKRLHMCYSFDLLTERGDADFLHHTLTTMEAKLDDGWPCWAIGNHDVVRVASRWRAENDDALRLYMAFLLTQRGSVCLYQGEELGLAEAELRFEELVDPYGIAFWPNFKGRDGCRTPHPWQAKGHNGGFSDVAPWLPVPESHLTRAVDRQCDEPTSLLNAYRAFLAFRRAHPALVKGEVRYHPVRDGVLCLERHYPANHPSERLLIALNFSSEPRTLAAPNEAAALTDAPTLVNGEWHNGSLALPAQGIAIASCSREAIWDV